MNFDKSKRITILLASGERLSIRSAIRRNNKVKKAARQQVAVEKVSVPA